MSFKIKVKPEPATETSCQDKNGICKHHRAWNMSVHVCGIFSAALGKKSAVEIYRCQECLDSNGEEVEILVEPANSKQCRSLTKICKYFTDVNYGLQECTLFNKGGEQLKPGEPCDRFEECLQAEMDSKNKPQQLTALV